MPARIINYFIALSVLFAPCLSCRIVYLVMHTTSSVQPSHAGTQRSSTTDEEEVLYQMREGNHNLTINYKGHRSINIIMMGTERGKRVRGKVAVVH